MKNAMLEAIAYIDSAVEKSAQFNNFAPEMSDRVLDNRIITLEGYIKYIDKEGLNLMKEFIQELEEETND
ncbi:MULTISPECIES: hypothetical protein [unclassified Halanaerobium]|uniref:hypothetical protein n=1 Tax=unclassified Halanaerobium TaxID=2641197 RepID=UPI000DF176B1|nr:MULTISPECIES: hypothetical protein [unclassified Halanaerobium]RCW45370.1 hypothetical protein DFR78_1172 [Halanaerobium sp. MA284_MarDTE_T2]RCW82548.1 hypothetical protein DER71_1192 [Halanaerobium sp. DL-01]